MTSINSVSAIIVRSAGLKFSRLAIASISLLLPAVVSAQQTFTGGGAVSLTSTQTTSSSSTLTIAGATGSSIATIKVALTGVTSNGESGFSLQPTTFLLQAPHGGPSLVLLGATGDGTDGDDGGDAGSGLNNVSITIQDGATPAPNGNPAVWPHTGSVTAEPSSYWNSNIGINPPLGTATDWPQSDGSATLTGRFAGTGISDGDVWTLTMINGDGYTTAVSVASWSMTVSYASTSPTTTSISSSLNPALTTNSVTLTATVTGSGTPTGTVAFSNNGSTISGCGSAVVSGGHATCSTTMAEGYHVIDAVYSGGGGFGPSSGSLTQLIEVQSIANGTNSWCNNISFSAALDSSPIAYPAIINISGYSAGTTVGNVTLELEGVTQNSGISGEFLLVAPGSGGQNLDFLDTGFNTAALSAVKLFISDAGTLTPNHGTPTDGGVYVPYDGNGTVDDTFPPSNSPIVDSNIPLVPGTIHYPAPQGGSNSYTLQQAFNGAPANGDWALYATAANQTGALTVGGWCITLTPNTGAGTTTTLSSSQQDAYTGTSVTLSATVVVAGTSTPVTSGTVEFKDQTTGTVLASAAALNSNGVATYVITSTNPLAEGDHKIVATYSGTGTYDTSFANMYQRFDDATKVTAVNSDTWQYCNTGTITIPMGTSGAETPNPSNIFVSNTPGTLNTATLTLNNFSILVGAQLDNTESLVVGPTRAALDFFSNTADGTIEDEATAGNYTFADSASGLVSSGSGNISPGTYKPTSYVGTDNANDVFTADPGGFYTLPGTFGYSASRSSSTFSSEFSGINPNGTWSLYFNSPNANANGTGAAGGWCVNLTQNPVTVSVALSHQGDGTGTDFVQGESAAQIATVVTAGNSTGPTGDPLGTNPLKVVDTLNSALTYTNASGTGWSCVASGQTVTCTNDSAVAQGAPYPTLTLNVSVSPSAPASISNGVTVSGAGITGNSGSDTITVDPTPALAVSKSHTGNFVQGETGQWNIAVSNTSASGSTSGTVTVADTLPSGYTLASYTSSGSLWTCSGTGSVTCTATPGIAGGLSSTITLTVNVPTNSPTSVSNTAFAWGGGDTVHTSQGTAAQSNADTVTVDAPPAITSAASTTFTVGSAGSFTIIGSGNPSPSFSETGSLPSGVNLVSNGNGTATLAGTPAAGTGGSYPIVVTASNGISPNATQNFTLTVDQAPAITSAASTIFTVGSAGSFTVTASGYPAPTFTETGTLPSGVTLSTSGLLSGTPAAGTSGSYPITITASNGANPNAPQNFTLTVNQPPAITSAASATFATGAAGSFTVTTEGYPPPALSETGALPSGVTFVDNGNGTATLAGTPALGTAGSYPLTILAANGLSPNGMQSFTLTVNPPPAFVVTTNADDASGNPSNCPIPSSGTTCTLRDALSAANQAGSGSISFDANAFSATNSTAQNTIALNIPAGGSLEVPGDTSIQGITSGSGATLANLVTVDGGGSGVANNGTIFVVIGTGAVINNLNINNGYASNGGNGGALTNFGSIAISGTSFKGNQASVSGGGIFNAGGTVTVVNSTFTSNSATGGNGGAIDNADYSGCGTTTVSNSTFYQNTAANGGSGVGGAINNDNGGCTLTLINSTIDGNSTDSNGGGIFNASSLNLANNVIAGNTNGASGADDVDDQGQGGNFWNGSNVINGNLIGAYDGNPQNGTNVSLAPLGNYGGPTQTMIPLPGSPAICAGSAGLIPSGVTTDQRGYPIENTTYPGYSSSTPCVDSGAVQSNYAIEFSTQPPSNAVATVALSPAPVVSLTESGEPISVSAGLVTMTDTANLLTGTLSEAITSGAADFGNLVIPQRTTGDTLNATLPLTSSINLTAQATTEINVAAHPATLTPSSGTLSRSQTFSWNNGVGPVEYELWVGTPNAGPGYYNVYDSGIVPNTTTSATVNIPNNGVDIYVTLRQLFNGAWQSAVYRFTEPGTEQNATLTATVSPGPSPASSGILTSSATFYWNNGAGPTEYALLLGTKDAGSSDLYTSGDTTATSTKVSIPSNGVTVWATLKQEINGVWQSATYTFTEPSTYTLATLTTAPTGPTTIQLTSPSTTFYWNNGNGPSEYLLNVGTTGKGSSNLYKGSATSNTATLQATVPIPDDGVNVYIEFGQLVNGTWQYAYYTLAAPGTPTYASLSTSPTAPATINLTSPNTAFYFIGGVGPTEYYLWLGTGTTGASQYNVYKGTAGTATQATVTTIPDDGANIYATLFQLVNGTWQSVSYTLTAPGSPTYATLSAPGSNTGTTPPTLLASQQFTWTGGVGPTAYQLLLGTTGAGSSNLYVGAETMATSATVTIPSKGATVYATLRQLFNGVWKVTNYTFAEP